MNKEILLATLKNYKAENAQKYRITALGLFGSFARDESSSASDVDVVVKIEIPDLYTIVHIKEELQDRLQLPVDIVRLRDRMNPSLKKRIERDVVYV